ncbi:magnesium/cobalt transporter CorA [Neobacillus fumarioli]|uniref:magnesium/cobalt transporter CorA n=1 Tax=Neobacillus fumarioli TaxID=105229 RepID=UPI000831DDC7|nr:magnesium/cobalt transporter CorA [Neobacillus fumarioli]
MIRTIAITKNHELKLDVEISKVVKGDFQWYWIDFNQPTDEECEFLRSPLSFHPLAIEDCMHFLQRPKLVYYQDYTFLVTQAISQDTMSREEIDFFLSEHYIVTFHQKPSYEINDVWNRLAQGESIQSLDPSHVIYLIIDKMVDNYFPPVYQIEDRLNEIDENSKGRPMDVLLDDLFYTRHQLLSLRHTINPMRDLIYRILNSQRMTEMQGKMVYFSNIHDHLLKLTEMIEAARELTTDIRDSYISINSYQTNHVMKVLTVITTIFMPITFIAGLYGMNFQNMPELHWKYGYIACLLVMFIVTLGLCWWFKKKGWFK